LKQKTVEFPENIAERSLRQKWWGERPREPVLADGHWGKAEGKMKNEESVARNLGSQPGDWR
jgi:hypothetical protein